MKIDNETFTLILPDKPNEELQRIRKMSIEQYRFTGK